MALVLGTGISISIKETLQRCVSHHRRDCQGDVEIEPHSLQANSFETLQLYEATPVRSFKGFRWLPMLLDSC